MNTISTTDARMHLSSIVDSVRMGGRAIAIGRRNVPEVLVIRYPRYNSALSDVTNLASVGGGFDFLADEPDLYSDSDLKKKYA